jgi:hypothetical protein
MHPIIQAIIHNLDQAGVTIGVVMEATDDHVTLGTLTEELVQFKKSVFPDGVSRSDRVIVTRCFIHDTVRGAILPPGWNMA